MASLALFAGCEQFPVIFPPSNFPITEKNVAGLERFADQQALKNYLADQLNAAQYRGADVVMDFGLPMATANSPSPPAAPGAEAQNDAAGGESHSQTNLQESGVDESDLIKTDGANIYIMRNNRLKIVKAVPADDMEVIADVELPGYGDSLYLNGSRMVVLSNRNDGNYYPGAEDGVSVPPGEPSVAEDPSDDTSEPSAGGSGGGSSGASTGAALAILPDPAYQYQPKMVVTLFDVSNPSDPEVTMSYEFEGYLVSSRMIDSRLHLVLSVYFNMPQDPQPAAVRAADIDDLIPDMGMQEPGGDPQVTDLVPWTEVLYPIDPDGYHLTAIVTLDVQAQGAPVKSVGVMADAATVYASQKALYLTDNDWQIDGQVRETTDVYQFDFTDSGTELAASGTIPGRPLNRFCFSEHEGFLRVATTTRDDFVRDDFGFFTEPAPSLNHVYVLGQSAEKLEVVGKIEDIAPGESIYSARFLGDRGFVVTFRQIDPLFTLDLSNPADPKVVGELKVPGVSDYIHILDENHLLTIGRETVESDGFTRFDGVQISLFDVTDFANPVQQDVETIGDSGTYSEAQYEPHAFNYYAPAGMLAVPMTIVENNSPDPFDFGWNPTFQGLMLFNVSAQNGISEADRIPTSTLNQWGWFDDGGWMRSVFIDQTIYAVTNSRVRAASLNDLNAVPHTLELKGEDEQDDVYPIPVDGVVGIGASGAVVVEAPPTEGDKDGGG